MSDRAKKEGWVREAIAITDALIEGAGGRYMCPLCLDWYSDLDELSLEHAPPRSVGGRQIAVTCRSCNSRGGHTVEAELRRAETIREFGKRAMTDSLGVTFRFGGVELRSEAVFGPDRLSIAGIPKQNHPDATSAMTAALEKAVVEGADGMTMQLAFRSPDFRKASIGWLRTGYLVAFATLGYLYILREELEVVRRQIREPEAEILGRYCVMTRSGPTEPLIAFVRDPGELQSVLVHSHECAVLLPSQASPGTYERLATIDPWPPGEQAMTGSVAPWPRRPAYALDRAALDRS